MKLSLSNHVAERALFLAIAAALSSCPLFGQTAPANTSVTWDGETSGSLFVASNWAGNQAPGTSSANALVFGNAGSGFTTVNVGSFSSFGFSGNPAAAVGFTAGASAYTFGGSSMGINTGGLSNASGQTQTFNNQVRFLTGTPTHTLSGANSAFDFNGTIAVNSTVTFSLGESAGQFINFDGNLTTTNVAPNPVKNTITFNGNANASTVNLNGADNSSIANLRIGQNVTVNVGSSSGLNAATTITMNQANSSLANTSGSAITSGASLAFVTGGATTFGAAGHTASNNIAFTGTAAISADLNRTINLSGTGLTLSTDQTWNNTGVGNRTLTVNGAGNEFRVAGYSIGATGESSNTTLTLSGTANQTVGSITNGAGTGTRSLQANSSGTITLAGASTYDGTTGVGNAVTLLVNGSHVGGGNYTVQGALGGTGTINLSAADATVSFASSGTRRLVASSTDSLVIVGGSAAALDLGNAADRLDGSPSFFFTLGAPGSTVIDVQGLLSLGGTAGALNFDDFSFTTGPGFGAGIYRLFDYTSISGLSALGSSITGIIDGLTSTVSNDAANGAIIVTVIPEPSSVAVFVGVGALAFVCMRRRR